MCVRVDVVCRLTGSTHVIEYGKWIGKVQTGEQKMVKTIVVFKESER